MKVTSLNRVSTSLMTCQKLYSSCFDRYKKQGPSIFDQIMHLKRLEQQIIEKNALLETQVARLESTISKLYHHLQQKNIHEGELEYKRELFEGKEEEKRK